jgi:hypothetical protein
MLLMKRKQFEIVRQRVLRRQRRSIDHDRNDDQTACQRLCNLLANVIPATGL